MKRISQMFAFIAIDPDGDEGIVATNLHTRGGFMMPLVGADMARVKSLRNIAQDTATRTGVEIKLVRFTNRQVLEDIKP